MSYYTYFGFWPISLKFITKKITLDHVSRGAHMSWLIVQNPCKYPKPEFQEVNTLEIVIGYLFK